MRALDETLEQNRETLTEACARWIGEYAELVRELEWLRCRRRWARKNGLRPGMAGWVGADEIREAMADVEYCHRGIMTAPQLVRELERFGRFLPAGYTIASRATTKAAKVARDAATA